MRHPLYLCRDINVAFLTAALGRGHHGHVNAALYLREKDVSVVHPGKPRRIGKHQQGLAAKHGHGPGIPGWRDTVSDARAVRGERRSRFKSRLVSELKRLTPGEQLDKDLATGHERVWTVNKNEHAPIGR